MPRPEKYHVPYQTIRRRILDGSYAAGERLPTEQQLCEEFALSRSCIRKALSQLQADKLVLTEAGNGHFATKAKQRNQRCQDTALIMPIRFKEWDVHNNRYLLYTLLEQHVVHHGGEFTHLQLDDQCTAEGLIAAVQASKATWVIVDRDVSNYLQSAGLFWCLLQNLGCRVVVTGFTGSASAAAFDQVGTDWASGTRRAVNYLLGKGCRRLLYAGYDGIDWSDDRSTTFLATLRLAGHWQPGEPAPVIPYPGTVGAANLRDVKPAFPGIAAANLYRVLQGSPVDAVVCVNDALTAALVNLAPLDQLPLLVSFDNSPWSQQHGVTSVSMDMRRHADRIFELLSEPPSPDTRLVRIPTILATR